MSAATSTMRAPDEAIVITPRVGSYSVRRYYDPATGQFITVDPAVDQTEAPYAYVSGDPIDGADPLGLGCVFGICTHSFDPMASLDAIVNIGRGATFGLTDDIANWIVPGASCTVAQNSIDQFIGGAATTLLGGEALDALIGSGRVAEFLGRLRSIDLADEAGSIGPSVDADVQAKILDEWGPGQPAKTGGGWRWIAGKGDYVRVDPADPASPDPLQRVPHVHVTSNGRVVASHLPLNEWLTWSSWDTP
jgi:hypothetical protein